MHQWFIIQDCNSCFSPCWDRNMLMVCDISFSDVAFEEWWIGSLCSSARFPLYVELICWTVHLLARKDQMPCQLNDVCGISGFCTWLWMLRFICRNYREGEARSVFCLFHAPVDFLIQRRRRMQTSEAPASTLLLYTSDHDCGRQRREVLSPQSSSS